VAWRCDPCARARACGSRGGWELADGRRVVIFF
jgi:hypothetical protein